jgi:predicted nucleic acid-binding protein
MRLFLDANILVSVLNKEYPLFSYSARIVSLADNKKFSVHTSPICLAIAFYFAEKKSGTALAKRKIDLLANKLIITPIGKNEVLQSLQNKKVNDFEDGMNTMQLKIVTVMPLLQRISKTFISPPYLYSIQKPLLKKHLF